MINDDDVRIRKKINFFLENQDKVHISKKTKEFLNGYFVKKISKEVYSFNDDVKGLIEIFTFDIFDISKFKEAGSE